MHIVMCTDAGAHFFFTFANMPLIVYEFLDPRPCLLWLAVGHEIRNGRTHRCMLAHLIFNLALLTAQNN